MTTIRLDQALRSLDDAQETLNRLLNRHAVECENNPRCPDCRELRELRQSLRDALCAL